MITSDYPAKFTIDDAQRAIDTWGMNCGPAALAVMLGLTPDQVRPHLGKFERCHYMSPGMMFFSLCDVGARFTRLDNNSYPRRGLMRVQWCGPWTMPGAHPMAKPRHTHWVGVNNRSPDVLIFDVNCMCVGGWVSLDEWKNQVVPWLLPQVEPDATGEWYPTHILKLL